MNSVLQIHVGSSSGLGIDPVSPVLAGGFLPALPPGKSESVSLPFPTVGRYCPPSAGLACTLPVDAVHLRGAHPREHTCLHVLVCVMCMGPVMRGTSCPNPTSRAGFLPPSHVTIAVLAQSLP